MYVGMYVWVYVGKGWWWWRSESTLLSFRLTKIIDLEADARYIYTYIQLCRDLPTYLPTYLGIDGDDFSLLHLSSFQELVIGHHDQVRPTLTHTGPQPAHTMEEMLCAYRWNDVWWYSVDAWGEGLSYDLCNDNRLIANMMMTQLNN